VPETLYAPVPEPDLSNPEETREVLSYNRGLHELPPPHEHGQPLPGMDFRGGSILDAAVGPCGQREHHHRPVGNFLFLGLFTQAMRTGSVKARLLKQIPWRDMGGMTDEDLAAVLRLPQDAQAGAAPRG